MRAVIGEVLIVVAAAVCVSPWGSPQVGLLMGMALALAGLTWRPRLAKKLSRVLIQACIVLLGLTINLSEVARAGVSGLVFAAGTIAGAFVVGLALARLLRVEGKLATLLCSGTAVCGGSAIAATSSVIRARDAHTSIALACVFLLNALALYLFPWLGHRLDLSQHQFGAWAAVAIHDVASVVGAGAAYGEVARADATIIKLVRVLWIVPIALATGWYWRRRDAREGAPGSPATGPGASAGSKRPGLTGVVPWFILLFLVTSTVRTLWPGLSGADPAIKFATRAGMSVALLLIGAGLSVRAVKEVGWRALLMATLLWVALSAAALAVVLRTVE